MKNNIYYFNTEQKFVAPFKQYEEGVHFCYLKEEAESIKGDLNSKKYLYSIEIPNLKPLYIDGDLLLWSGPNIANLFLHKLNNETYESPFEENPKDIKPSQVNILLNEKDREYLEKMSSSIGKRLATEEEFTSIMNFIKSKGFNCISYLLYEGGYKYRAICLDAKDIKNKDYASVKLIEEYSNNKFLAKKSKFEGLET